MAKKPDPFNNPFGALKLPAKDEPKKPAARVTAAPSKARPSSDEDEAALFREAIGGVNPVRAPKGRVQATPRTVDEIRIPTEEAESLTRLAELVTGEGPFELTGGTEFIEGAVKGFDDNVRKKLKAGTFALDATLDLHGLKRDEAKPVLERFIQDSRVAGRRCVLVITGRGLHSDDQVPVLKSAVQEWLTHGRPARQVLAFCSAQQKDGGAGAVYVLLRR